MVYVDTQALRQLGERLFALREQLLAPAGSSAGDLGDALLTKAVGDLAAETTTRLVTDAGAIDDLGRGAYAAAQAWERVEAGLTPGVC